MNFMKKIKLLLILNKDKIKINKIIVPLIKKKFNFITLKYDDDKFFFTRKHTFDYTLSFLSKKILKKNFLKRTKYFNINFHPGPPRYPGIGCYNFALLNNEKKYGVTAHEINEKIDNGKIITIKYFTLPKNCSLEKLIKLSYDNLIKLFCEVIKMIKDNNLNFSNENWKRKAYTKKDLDKASEIKLTFTKVKIIKILKCFYFKNTPPPFIKLRNIKFYYDNNYSKLL